MSNTLMSAFAILATKEPLLKHHDFNLSDGAVIKQFRTVTVLNLSQQNLHEYQKPGGPKKPRGGGQPGHEQHLRQSLPEDRVNETIDYEINDAYTQRLRLTAFGEFETTQHVELTESPTWVTNQPLAACHDADGNGYLPNVPESSGPIFGPPMLAMIV
jgi:hypothetical protein